MCSFYLFITYRFTYKLERAMGFGPTTSTLARLRSTPELYPHRLTKVFIAVFFIYARKIFMHLGFFLITFCFKPNKNYPQYKIHIYFLNKLYTIMPYYIKHIILPLKTEQSCQKKTAKRVFKTRVLKKKPER